LIPVFLYEKELLASLLAALKEAGILRVVRQGAGRRPTVYVFPELLNICEERKILDSPHFCRLLSACKPLGYRLLADVGRLGYSLLSASLLVAQSLSCE